MFLLADVGCQCIPQRTHRSLALCSLPGICHMSGDHLTPGSRWVRICNEVMVTTVTATMVRDLWWLYYGHVF